MTAAGARARGPGGSRVHGFTVHEEHGDLAPEMDDVITGLIAARFWFGIT